MSQLRKREEREGHPSSAFLFYLSSQGQCPSTRRADGQLFWTQSADSSANLLLSLWKRPRRQGWTQRVLAGSQPSHADTEHRPSCLCVPWLWGTLTGEVPNCREHSPSVNLHQ